VDPRKGGSIPGLTGADIMVSKHLSVLFKKILRIKPGRTSGVKGAPDFLRGTRGVGRSERGPSHPYGGGGGWGGGGGGGR